MRNYGPIEDEFGSFGPLKEEAMRVKIENPDSLKEALVNAAHSTRSVMLRDHILPERVVRVGEFVTALRRELAHSSNASLTRELTDTSLWSDVLQLKYRNGSANWGKYDAEFISSLECIVDSAIEEMEESNPKMIENSLSDMSSQLSSLDVCIGRLAELNKEADKIVSDFDKLLDEMAG